MIKRVLTLRTVVFLFQAFLALGAGMVIGALLHSDPSVENRGAVAGETTAVLVSSQREGDTVRFFVDNMERTEITMTFDFHVVNMECEVEFPYTATFRPGKSDAFTLTPGAGSGSWEYSYTNYFKLGSSVAVPDSYVYELPYAPGRAYRVTQAFNGKFSHKGSNKYAVDWQMPEGTPVHAARGGLVVKVKDDSDKGGNHIKYDRYNNYILIRHVDGTLGHYCHLQRRGAKVNPGDTVHAGQLIALSGNTGFSSGAHLHFCVFKTRNGRERESIPVRFRSANGEGTILVEGRRYRAPSDRGALVASLDVSDSVSR